MNNIKKYPFSELYEMSSGISTTKAQAGHGYPFVSFGTVFNNYFLPEQLTDLMDTSEKEQDIYSIKEGDILITRTSETIDELAMSCVATKDYPKATYSGFTKRLRPKTTGIVYHKYLAFYLRGYLFRKAVTNNAFMTLRASFNEDIFSFLNLYLPEYQEQVKIGDMLYNMEQKISLNQKICSELEAVAKTLYDYWFVQFDFPDKNGKPYRISGGEMVWNEQLKREIPKGWSVKPIIDEFDVCYGYPFDTTKFTEDEDGIPIIRIRDILENTTSAKTLEIVDEKYKVNRGDLIVGMDGNFHMNFWSGHPALLNQRCFKISSLGYSVLIAYFSAKPYIKAREKNVTRTTVGHLSADDVQGLFVLVPTEPEKQKFSAIFDDILNKICQTRSENEELTKLRDWLLPMLMNGQARVE